MTTATKLIFFAIVSAGLPMLAQEHENDWDITKIDVSKLPPAASRQGVTYEKDIQPLFKASCLRCHGEQKPKARLRLDSLETVLKGGDDGKVVIPGDSKKSLLVAAAACINDKIAMPPKRRPRAGGGAGGPPPPGAPPGDAGPSGGSGGPPGPGGPPQAGGPPPSGGPAGPGGGGRGGPPPKPLTVEQVGLVRAWIDQGAK